MKNLLKNRIVIGFLCIITALIICFGLTPMFNNALTSKVELVRVSAAIKKGDQITAGMVTTVETGGYNLPSDVVYKKDDVIGKYANADLYKGDYILKSKLSDTALLKNEYLSGLNGKNRAISVTIKSFAAGLSGKLENGDIISLIASDVGESRETKTPDELQYVEVIATTDSKGVDQDVQKKKDDNKDSEDSELASTIALILYLITSPFSALAGWLVGDEQVAVENLQNNYGYNQSIGIYNQDYTEGNGQSYADVIFKDGSTEVVYFNQLDEGWADKPYGSDKIGTSACGPTAMSIVVSSLTGKTVDPPAMAQWSVDHGDYCAGNGSYHQLIPDAAKAWGLSCTGNLLAQNIVDALSGGKLVVVIMSKGHFTSSGHFIVLRGVTSKGKILVADPASYKRSQQEWDLSLIMNEARKGAGAGGPYWAIGKV